jgi:hypothetical protein
MVRKKKVAARSSPSRPPPARKGFVGRDASPVLDRYPPKDPELAPKGPPGGTNASPSRPREPPAPAAVNASTPPPTAATSAPLITLEPTFDLDEFAGLLGETSIRVIVPREDVPELLRRVSDFMGFGIYVYSITVRPAPSELLKSFVVELQRVDYSPADRAWVPFVEKGASDSPFGPSGTRT